MPISEERCPCRLESRGNAVDILDGRGWRDLINRDDGEAAILIIDCRRPLFRIHYLDFSQEHWGECFNVESLG